MIFVPLPFVVALLLIILIARMLRQETSAERRPFLFLIVAYTLQSILIGIHWGYGVRAILPIQSVLATLIAALTWVSFKNLTTESPVSLARFWPHVLPAALTIFLLLFWREPVGPTIILIFLAYGAALLRLAQAGPDRLVSSRLDGALLSHRSLWITGIALITSAVTDIIISYDYALSGGQHTGAIIALGNVIALLGLGYVAAVASGGQPADEPTPEPLPSQPQPTEEDHTVAESLNALMQSREIYRDTELNLTRLARRMGMPARRVSTAINRIHGMSVSQYVNDFRIKAACDQLLAGDDPVTRVMFDCGFISKSNFNREFSRVTGFSPTEFKRRHPRTETVAPIGANTKRQFVSP